MNDASSVSLASALYTEFVMLFKLSNTMATGQDTSGINNRHIVLSIDTKCMSTGVTLSL